MHVKVTFSFFFSILAVFSLALLYVKTEHNASARQSREKIWSLQALVLESVVY